MVGQARRYQSVSLEYRIACYYQWSSCFGGFYHLTWKQLWKFRFRFGWISNGLEPFRKSAFQKSQLLPDRRISFFPVGRKRRKFPYHLFVSARLLFKGQGLEYFRFVLSLSIPVSGQNCIIRRWHRKWRHTSLLRSKTCSVVGEFCVVNTSTLKFTMSTPARRRLMRDFKK